MFLCYFVHWYVCGCHLFGWWKTAGNNRRDRGRRLTNHIPRSCGEKMNIKLNGGCWLYLCSDRSIECLFALFRFGLIYAHCTSCCRYWCAIKQKFNSNYVIYTIYAFTLYLWIFPPLSFSVFVSVSVLPLRVIVNSINVQHTLKSATHAPPNHTEAVPPPPPPQNLVRQISSGSCDRESAGDEEEGEVDNDDSLLRSQIPASQSTRQSFRSFICRWFFDQARQATHCPSVPLCSLIYF